MKNKLLVLFKQPQTVFTSKEIALLWQEKNKDRLKSALKYYVDQGELIRLRRGIYAKPKFNPQEAAIKIYSPAYISFETVLTAAGVIYQYYGSIFVASYLSREIKLATGEKIIYRRLKNEILYLSEGIKEENNCFVASPERALVDTVYLFGEIYFDNLNPLNWEKILAIASLFKNKALLKTLKKIKPKAIE